MTSCCRDSGCAIQPRLGGNADSLLLLDVRTWRIAARECEWEVLFPDEERGADEADDAACDAGADDADLGVREAHFWFGYGVRVDVAG